MFPKILGFPYMDRCPPGASADKLADLADRIRNGNYHPDVDAIADKIMMSEIISNE